MMCCNIYDISMDINTFWVDGNSVAVYCAGIYTETNKLLLPL